ncbi:MAG: hypothetical protein KDB01_01260, partial [Planctomycetaceae bacterium]|nr:hypothetical protein [Planctomycetaceae bacterium]
RWNLTCVADNQSEWRTATDSDERLTGNRSNSCDCLQPSRLSMLQQRRWPHMAQFVFCGKYDRNFNAIPANTCSH